jgi:cytochrome c5
MKKRIIRLTGILILAALAGWALAACGQTSAPVAADQAGSNNLQVLSTEPRPPSETAPAREPAVPSTNTPAQAANNMDGQALLQQRCSVCHAVSPITRLQGTASQWKMVVDVMVSYGARLTPDEEQTLVNYLAQNFHP